MVSVASKFDTTTSEKNEVSIFERPIEDLIGWLAVCGCAFLNLANILSDKEEVGMDIQVLAKLGLIGVGGLYGFHGLLTRPKVRTILSSFPMVWLLIIGVCYFIAVPFSISPRNSLVSTCSIAGVVLMTVTALDHLGVINVIKAIFAGMSLFILGSWTFYFAVPSIGVFAEPISGGEFVKRMAGLAHPNTLGQFSGLTVVIATILYFSYRQRNILIAVIGILALGALINSFSRTSLLACMLALIVGYRHIYLRKEYFGTYMLGAAVFLVGILILSTQIDIGQALASKLDLLSKSEGPDELTTATGRSKIWAHAIYLLGQQPVTGYGAATQKYFFAEYSFYTHNMLLNIAFSGGVFAGIAALLMILGRLRALFFTRHPLADAIVVFIIINGLFENVIFSILAGLPTMLWVVALAWPLLQDDEAVKQLARSELVQKEERSRFIRLES